MSFLRWFNLWTKWNKGHWIYTLVIFVILSSSSAKAIDIEFYTSQPEIYINQTTIIEIHINSLTDTENISEAFIEIKIPQQLQVRSDQIYKDGFLNNSKLIL